MPTRPNILILHCDQLRHDCVGFAGNPHVRTPNIDRLASQAQILSRHIVANTICMPSRASLLTGLYPPAHGVWTNGVPLNRRDYLKPATNDLFWIDWPGMPAYFQQEIPTMADVFAAAGYKTASFGKLHLTNHLAHEDYGFQESSALWQTGKLDDWHGPYYGFEHVDMTVWHGEEGAHVGHYANWLRESHPAVFAAAQRNCLDQERPMPSVRDFYHSVIPAEAHNTRWLADRFDDYLAAHTDDQPFFAFVGFPDPHHPFNPSPEIAERFADCPVHSPADPKGKALADSALSHPNLKNISDLPQEDLHTIIRHTYAMMYQVDQAVGRITAALEARQMLEDTIILFTSDHGDFLGDHSLLLKGQIASDSLLRVPCFLRIPGSAAGELPQATSNCDLLPSLCALAKVAAPERCDGHDIFAPDHPGQACAFMASGQRPDVNHVLYTKRYRYTLYPHRPYDELYDHQNDPEETRNLAQDPAWQQTRQELRQTLTESLLGCYDPMLHQPSSV